MRKVTQHLYDRSVIPSSRRLPWEPLSRSTCWKHLGIIYLSDLFGED